MWFVSLMRSGEIRVLPDSWSIIEVKDQGNTPKVSILKDTYHWTKNTHSLRIVKCGSTKRFALTQMQHFHTFWRFFCFICLHFLIILLCQKTALSLKVYSQCSLIHAYCCVHEGWSATGNITSVSIKAMWTTWKFL